MIYPGCYPESEQDTMDHIRGLVDELYPNDSDFVDRVAGCLNHIMAISNDKNLRLRLAIFADRLTFLKGGG